MSVRVATFSFIYHSSAIRYSPNCVSRMFKGGTVGFDCVVCSHL
jgi:hypothetical protein